MENAADDAVAPVLSRIVRPMEVPGDVRQKQHSSKAATNVPDAMLVDHV